MRNQHLQRIYNRLSLTEGVSVNDFKKCLVHISVYEKKQNNTNPGNSRFVFLGMYAFKGHLAEVLNGYISGNGKQLQHYLGNVFSNERLALIFDEWELEKCVQVREGMDFNKLKHVFTQALLGFIYLHGTDDFKQEFVYRYFLKDSEHLLPKAHRMNQVLVLKAKAAQVLDEKVKMKHERADDGESVMYTTQVLLSTGEVIGSHSSKSSTYARKKAVKNALKHVLEIEAATPKFQEIAEKQAVRDTEAAKRAKAERQKEHLERMESKRIKRAAVKEQKKQEALEREIKRVLNKKNAKARGKALTEREKILEQLADPNIAPSKRQFLEDKLK